MKNGTDRQLADNAFHLVLKLATNVKAASKDQQGAVADHLPGTLGLMAPIRASVCLFFPM